MAKYLISNKAVNDLSKIWNYTFDVWSENQADRYYKMLIESFQQIAETPQIGKNYDGVLSQLLGYKIGHHIIFYSRESEENILVIRILHEKMDLKNRIKE